MAAGRLPRGDQPRPMRGRCRLGRTTAWLCRACRCPGTSSSGRCCLGSGQQPERGEPIPRPVCTSPRRSLGCAL
uniref:Uncharacterized protein n=1 Tax=uncultured marine virus TaxID=186617 RepID=A0A0F7L563_9VIRU|nr:hypothetical protein [uncultured marine virus]